MNKREIHISVQREGSLKIEDPLIEFTTDDDNVNWEDYVSPPITITVNFETETITSKEEVIEENLPESWDEVKTKDHRSFVGCNINIKESLYALSQLYDLRQEYWRIANWEPDWQDGYQLKHVIKNFDGDPKIFVTRTTRHFLAFPTREQANHFLKHHQDLIEKAEEFLP